MTQPEIFVSGMISMAIASASFVGGNAGIDNSDRVQGVKYSTLGGAFWNLYELKVTEK